MKEGAPRYEPGLGEHVGQPEAGLTPGEFHQPNPPEETGQPLTNPEFSSPPSPTTLKPSELAQEIKAAAEPFTADDTSRELADLDQASILEDRQNNRIGGASEDNA